MKNLLLLYVCLAAMVLSAVEAKAQTTPSASPSLVYHQIDLSPLKSRYARELFREKAGEMGLHSNQPLGLDHARFVFYRKVDVVVSDEVIHQLIAKCVLSDSLSSATVKKAFMVAKSGTRQAHGEESIDGDDFTDESEVQLCEDANVFCGSNVYSFPAQSGTGNPAQPGPYYGCLGSQPNPTWYFMQILDAGPIEIEMFSTPQFDIDFICWGPFDSPTGGCETGLTQPNVIDCSFSGSWTETCNIPNAIPNKFYILLITNYSGQPCEITFSQNFSSGSGSTNCNIVINCSMLSITRNVSACNPATNTYSLSGQMEFSNPPTAGTLTISDNTGISQTFNPPFNSPLNYTLNNIPCDGQGHTVTASFSEDPDCNLSENYNAPEAACPGASIKGGGEICNDGSTIAVNIAFSGVGPFDFTYAINGNPTTITGYTESSYLIEASIAGDYTMVSVQNALCPGTVSGLATVVVHPLPVVSLGADTSLCFGSTIQLDAGAGFKTYAWSPGGTTQQTLLVTAPGIYSVVVTDFNACSNSDEITVGYHDAIEPKDIKHN